LLGPLFTREWLTVPRRSRHYVTRAAYLGGLWILGLTAWQAIVGWDRTPSLGDTARFGGVLFQLYAVVQLTLVLFFSALSAASAVALEKDRRTFILLLLTDLRSYEIVLGKLFGSLLQIGLLLAGVIPLLASLLLLGGVAFFQVVQIVLVLAATAVAAGSLGSLIGLWREKTFQALALTVLFLVLYICVAQAIVFIPPIPLGPIGFLDPNTLRNWFDPYHALQGVLGATTEDAVTPAYGFAAVMLGWTALLNGWGIWRLRVWNPSGEPIMQREKVQDADDKKDRAKAHAAPGGARIVGENPILWREIWTRAYGRRPLLIKLAYYLVIALVCYVALPAFTGGGGERPWYAPLVGFIPAAAVTMFLMSAQLVASGANFAFGHRLPFTKLAYYIVAGLILYFVFPSSWYQAGAHSWYAAALGIVPVGVLSLLLVSAQGVTAITSERDTGALDLLLVTDLSPKEFIFGKLGGILYNVEDFLGPPLVLAGVYAWLGLLATPPRAYYSEMLASQNFEAMIFLNGAAAVLLAFAMVLGIHVALRTSNSRLAVVNTLGTIFFLTVGTLICIYLILINRRFESQWASFVFFLVAGIGGLWWILNGERPSHALTIAAALSPVAVFYSVQNLLIGRPGSDESSDPLVPFLVICGSFGFAIAAMLVPLISEFDVAFGRTTGGAD
jgi:ABC-type transport system involved in multi-copper enzyme maturation permease subunit